MADCEKVNIPKVDNSEIKCEEYTKAECTYLTNLEQDLIDYYDLENPAPLEDVINKILRSIKDLRQRVLTLEEL